MSVFRHKEMDQGRYGLQQGWENNSAFDGYDAVHEANFRVSGAYNERKFADERYSRDNIHPRNAFHQDMLERDNYPPSSEVGPWPQTRRRSHENEIDRFQDYNRSSRYGGHDHDDYVYDDYDYKSRSRERDRDCDRRSYDSDYERHGRRESSWRSHDSRERDHEKRGPSREVDRTPSPRRHYHSRSRGRDDSYRSRSPRGRSHGRDYREDSYDDGRFERSDRRRDREYSHERYSVAPSATLVVKGLSQKTTEEDLYRILAEWGPLRHVRVIKERDSTFSRGFAFIDFPSVGAARALMDKVGDGGLVVDGRKLFFDYSSKPSGGAGGTSFGSENTFRSSKSSYRSMMVPADWMCIICGCNNFARRTSCFQCNEPRADDAPAVEMGSSHPIPMGKKGDAGPTHVLVVRGLDENADEDLLRYEFSKHAPIKDLRLVRDKFTHVPRGFAFIHFHTVEDATKALEATNGTTFEKNGQILRVAFAKSVIGPGSGQSGYSHSSSRAAAAAIEAAAFSQQYDASGWAPKEYNPDEKQSTGGQESISGAVDSSKKASAPQSGFVWDEASGYYYDAASGFYYDGNTGLYYDGNSGIWYTFDQSTQQYVPCTDQNDTKVAEKQSETPKPADNPSSRKVVISAPAATIKSSEKAAASLPDAVQAAASAAMAAEKKEKERLKEIKLASKSSILANKKKMNNVLTMWKQRSVEGQAPRVVLDGNQPAASADDKPNATVTPAKNKYKSEAINMKENPTTKSGFTSTTSIEPEEKPKPVVNSSGGTITGVIRGSGRGLVKSDNTYSGAGSLSLATNDSPASAAPFRTDLSALGSYTPPVAAGSGRRRFSEMPAQPASATREQPQTGYRDRAAERRSLYGSSSSLGDDISDRGAGDSHRDSGYKKGLADPTPFPPGVGVGQGSGEATMESYEVATTEKAIDESNVGNRMLRNMGWQEGLGLGKDGSGMIEPVQAQAVEKRAGLGSQQKKRPTDPDLEVQAGDSYRTVIHKKAIARFREMN